MSEKSSSRLYALDAFRGLACLAVVLFHYTLLQPQAQLGFKYGVTGVDIFFLFSGFVVLMSVKETATFRGLVVNRIARLYPAYWAAVLFTGYLYWYWNVHGHVENMEFTKTLFANLSMFQYYLNKPNLDGPYWTMTYEILFFGFMLAVFLSKGLKHMEKIAMGGIVFTAIRNFVFKYYLPDVFTFLQKGLPILSHFAVFMCGILFYKIRTEGATWWRILIIIAGYCVQLSSFENGGMSHVYITFNEYFVILTLYFIIMFLLVYDKLNFIAIKPILFLGNISYPLFLIHQFIGRSVIIAVLVLYEHYPFWLAVAVALAVSIGLAFCISKFVEKQAGNFIRKKFLPAKP
jgi:peptidoglycan/LPS O-acetylase OafA/YrhL